MDVSPIITVTAVVKQFGRFAALRGVNADFTAGRLYAILGDNGAGKTTLLRVLAGLVQPTRGSIQILGTHRPSARYAISLATWPIPRSSMTK